MNAAIERPAALAVLRGRAARTKTARARLSPPRATKAVRQSVRSAMPAMSGMPAMPAPEMPAVVSPIAATRRSPWKLVPATATATGRRIA